MAKYYIGCEGSQEEFYDFVLDLASKIEYAKFPWEHPSVQRAMREGELAKPEEAPAATTETKMEPISADNILPGTPTPTTPTTQPAQAEAEEPAQPVITRDELQDKCADLGERFGKDAFKELKAKAGFTSMKALDAKGRADFAAMIDQYIKEHSNA